MTANILIIDDSEDDQRLYRRALKHFDCRLEMVSTAEAGFARVAEARPDMILLDFNLPDGDGLSFIKRLAEYVAPPIPVVMLTGQDSVEVAVEAMKNGVNDYLLKDMAGQYLRLLPGVVKHVMVAQEQRELTTRLQKQTEARLRLNQALMQNSMDGIHVMDMGGNIVAANDAFCRMLGYTRGEMAHLNVADWATEFSAGELRARFRDHIGKNMVLETVHRCKDGALINVEIGIAGMEIEGQNFIFASSRDVTGRKQAQRAMMEAMQELEKKELAKTRFIAAAGHDLRQPLAAASLYIDTLKRANPTQDQNEIISRLGQVMDTFKALLDALLNISKLDAGAIKPEYVSVNVSELIICLEENFAPMAAEKQLEFRLFFPIKETLFVRSDIGLINSVLMNLVSNAIKFTPKGGILISGRRRGGDVLIQVWDTGIGIPEEHLSHVFDEFYQVNNPQRDRASGLGLGLAIVERALALLGVTVEFRSRAGRGSVFGFRLPVDATSGAYVKHAGHAALQEDLAEDVFAKGKRFVIVEDDVLVAEAMYKALVVLGGEVQCFHNAEDAMRHADAGHADYYIVDFMLGGPLNGIQFLNQFCQTLGRPIKAVLLTGDTSSDLVRRVADCDWPVLHKPVNISELLVALARQVL